MVTPFMNGWAMGPEQQQALMRIATGELDFLFPEAVAWANREMNPTAPLLAPPPPPPPAPILAPSPSPSTPRKRAADVAFIDGSPGKKQKTTPTKSSRGVSSTPSTPSSGELTFIACTPASSPHTPRKRVPSRTAAIPKSWAEASAEDHMLFELKNAGGSWQQIANAWNSLFHESFTPRSLSSRWQRVKAKIGLPPPEEPTGDELNE